MIPDVRGGSREASVFRGLLGDQLTDGSDAFLHSFMWVPLVVRGQISGILTITNPRLASSRSAIRRWRWASRARPPWRLRTRDFSSGRATWLSWRSVSDCPANCTTPSRRPCMALMLCSSVVRERLQATSP